MIQLNLHRSSCAETNDINGRTETTCDYAQTTHGKRLLLILLTGGRSEKHVMWKSTQFLFGELAVTGGTECSSVVEQWHCKLCAAGSIPAFPIPMNCNHWNLFLLLRSVPVFLVGRFMPFKSAHWTFLIKEMVFMDTKGCKCCCTCK